MLQNNIFFKATNLISFPFRSDPLRLFKNTVICVSIIGTIAILLRLILFLWKPVSFNPFAKHQPTPNTIEYVQNKDSNWTKLSSVFAVLSQNPEVLEHQLFLLTDDIPLEPTLLLNMKQRIQHKLDLLNISFPHDTLSCIDTIIQRLTIQLETEEADKHQEIQVIIKSMRLYALISVITETQKVIANTVKAPYKHHTTLEPLFPNFLFSRASFLNVIKKLNITAHDIIEHRTIKETLAHLSALQESHTSCRMCLKFVLIHNNFNIDISDLSTPKLYSTDEKQDIIDRDLLTWYITSAKALIDQDTMASKKADAFLKYISTQTNITNETLNTCEQLIRNFVIDLYRNNIVVQRDKHAIVYREALIPNMVELIMHNPTYDIV